MPLRAVLLASTHLVRQPIGQSLGALDMEVHESADLADVIARINELAPDLLVMDADGMARQWRALAAVLTGSRASVALVLLATRFSFEDAHDAQALQVAAVIVKPFRHEEHSLRLLDAALARRGIRPQRTSPRLRLAAGEAALRVTLPAGERTLEAVNLAPGGALLRPEGSSPFAPGEFIASAALDWGDVRAEVALDVIHETTRGIGVRFSRIFDGAPRLERAMEERLVRAIGRPERRRRW